MDNSDCGVAALWVENGSVGVVTGSVETLWVKNWPVGVDTGETDAFWVEDRSVGMQIGNSGIDTPELDPEVGNDTFDAFSFVTLHSGRYSSSSSSSLLAVSAVTCIMSWR